MKSFTLLLLSALLLVGSADLTSASGDGACHAQLVKCAANAAQLGTSFAGPIKACRALRKCKKECRMEKRDDVRECRHAKRDCKKECRSKQGRGKRFRKCRRDCRRDKRSCKKAARKEKRICRNVCRNTYKTPECRAARKKVLTTTLKSVGSCLAFVKCLDQNSR